MPDQCRAVTEGGERCSRPAKENGFCHQHGPENETVDEADAAETTDADEDDEREDSNVPEDTDSEEETESADSTESESDSDSRNESESEEEEETEETDDEKSQDETHSDSASDSEEPSNIVTVRNRVRDQVPQLIGRELDGVTSLMQGEEGWVATVELIERRSVPDTQDIIGQYEVSLTDDGVIHEYRRLETYRRADGSDYET
ncbi:gas vesicle synthesis family protein [Halogeometricum pallidum JCM 14848]|uniref:Gas vesicle synthesis family protein n=1 Tax=Halogeometricum pallidum JCM 14848 TaxID=1227487 RepID=M0CWG2_HALPD|nr:gas vesicle protein GvpO [Halogeometricum pallidum]ELZ26792.1 gas vesicle synthesis family protein [Halogeometricum pallidum JCM 14848]